MEKGSKVKLIEAEIGPAKWESENDDDRYKINIVKEWRNQGRCVYTKKNGLEWDKSLDLEAEDDSMFIRESHSLFIKHNLYEFFQVHDRNLQQFLMKSYTITKSIIKHHVRFYKDFLYSLYLEHENVLSPKWVYLKPQPVILYEEVKGPSLDKFYPMETEEDENDPYHEYRNTQHTFREMLEILRYLTIAVNHCHNKGIVVMSICSENVVFTDPKKISSLKITDFSKSLLLHNKSKFYKRLMVDQIPRLNKLEKMILLNKDKLENHSEYVENSFLVYKPPELLFKRPFSYKLDVWSIGILFHLMIFKSHVYEMLEQKRADYMSKGMMKSAFEDPETGELLPLKFDDEYYETIPPLFLEILKRTLEVDPEKRISSRRLLTLIKNVDLEWKFMLDDKLENESNKKEIKEELEVLIKAKQLLESSNDVTISEGIPFKNSEKQNGDYSSQNIHHD